MTRAVRRRRLALAAAAGLAAVAGAILGGRSSNGDDAASTASSPTSPAPPQCPADVASDRRRLAGQMLVVRMEATATTGLRRAVRRGEIGGVVLFPPPGTPADALGEQVRALGRVATKSGSPAPLVMIDQEGGEVKRLADQPPSRSPAEIAGRGSGAAAAQGQATGRALARLGINADLAPVLDVPGVDGAFIATRAFATEPAEVATLGTAFGAGLQSAGVAATAKHFPGLGLATVNTDLAPSTVEASRAELTPGLEPFAAASEAGFGLVMVANATYPAYDAKRPASQSPRVIEGLLRRRLGFGGAVVTDDLGAGALTGAGIDEGEAAVGAAGAGADLLLFALSAAEAARDALVRALRSGELDRAALVESCARTTALRERFPG